MDEELIQYVWHRLDKSAGPNECWPWPGVQNGHGYGRLTWHHESYAIHRVVYEMFNEPIPPGQNVCHSCDNPICSNPRHLWLGTLSDNMLDMYLKGRAKFYSSRPGTQNLKAKLTEADVLAIRAAFASDNPPTKNGTAREYGVSRTLIQRVVARVCWTHI